MESVDDAFASTQAEITALKRVKPKSAAEARQRVVELNRLQQALIEASKRVVDESAAKRVANGNRAAPAKSAEVVATDMSPQLLETLLTGLARGMLPFLREQIAEAVTPLKEHIAELEGKALTDGDIWREGVSYRRNALVTHNGHLWLARRETNKRPPGDDWRLTHHNNKARA